MLVVNEAWLLWGSWQVFRMDTLKKKESIMSSPRLFCVISGFSPFASAAPRSSSESADQRPHNHTPPHTPPTLKQGQLNRTGKKNKNKSTKMSVVFAISSSVLRWGGR